MKIRRTIKSTINYKAYRCGCGRQLIPRTNPSKCPYCGRVTRLIGV